MAVRVLKDLLTDLPDVPLIPSGVAHAAYGCSGAGAVRSGHRRNNSESWEYPQEPNYPFTGLSYIRNSPERQVELP
jgi:hypothetical protein